MSTDTPLIIAAVDTSSFLEPVVQCANRMAQCLDARLVVLHVFPAKSANFANEASYGDMTLRSNEEQDLEAEVKLRQELEPRIKALGINPSVLEIMGGSAARTIDEQLEKREADLLVLGQPKSRLSSVATKMAKNASCDVYVVRVGE
ncbi:MAG: universal stress protein [Proteobacteria bacterium]|jgi:nucleotide-binding universal stress UspA family protein|nr:universal stress protein [Pseudomonadota bacterium]